MKILLVDDDRLILAALAPGLRAAGYCVETADSGEKAIDLCKRDPPDLAVLDIHMPGTDGIAVSRWLRENTGARYVFLSASGSEEITARAAAEGALCCLEKPVAPIRLLEIVRSKMLQIMP